MRLLTFGALHKNNETDILDYGGKGVKWLITRPKLFVYEIIQSLSLKLLIMMTIVCSWILMIHCLAQKILLF